MVGRCLDPWDPPPTSRFPRGPTSRPSRRCAIRLSTSARTRHFVHGWTSRSHCCSEVADAPSRCRSISATSNTGCKDERPMRHCGGPTRRLAHSRETPAGHPSRGPAISAASRTLSTTGRRRPAAQVSRGNGAQARVLVAGTWTVDRHTVALPQSHLGVLTPPRALELINSRPRTSQRVKQRSLGTL